MRPEAKVGQVPDLPGQPPNPVNFVCRELQYNLRMRQLLATALPLSPISHAQTRPAWIQQHYENLDFSASPSGTMPLAWHLGPEGTTLYSALTSSGAACNSSKQCATLRSTPIGAHDLFPAFLYQVYTEPAIGRHDEVFIAVKNDNSWHIQLHQPVD